MSLRSGKASNRLSLAAVCLGGAFAFAAALSGCVGAGDDNSIPAAPSGDGGAGDARSGDGASGDGAADGHASDGAEASADAISDAAHDGGDATMRDGGGAATPEGGGDSGPAGAPQLGLATTAVDFGLVSCGSIPAATISLTMTNNGGGLLAVSASLVGSAFAFAGPTSLMLPHGMSGAITVTASVPGSSTAGTPLLGSLALFTNDAANANRVLPLSVTPSGAMLTGTSLYVFPSSKVGTPSSPVAVQLTNSGNASAVFAFSAPSDPSVTIPGSDAGGLTLKPGDTWGSIATFTPTKPGAVTSTAAINSSGGLCGASVASIRFQGSGDTGNISGWLNAIDFGPALCGGAAPPPQKVTLTNSGPSDTLITQVDATGAGLFTTDATVGGLIAGNGGTLTITFHPPPVPSPSSLSAVTGTIAIHTDADPLPAMGTTVNLTEEPQGAVLAFDTGATVGFGSFGTVILLQSEAQSFNVTNAGNGPANVSLIAAENGSVSAGRGAGDAGFDATVADADVGSAGPTAFSVSPQAFTIPATASRVTPALQEDSVTFQPVHANATNGAIAMTVDPTTALCAPLPASLPLSGNAIGGSLAVQPTSLIFNAVCGGSAPGAKSFVVSNAGSVDLNWTMTAPTGPGGAQYTVASSAAPGLLIPGSSVTVMVTAAKVPSPAPNPNPAAMAAQIAIATDVPFDPEHVVTLTEVAVGDQLSVSVGSLRFGQVPLGTAINQTFTVTNNANPGSPDAQLSLSVISGSDSGGISYSAQSAGNIAAGAQSTETVTFNATNPGAYPATLAFTTTDALCTPPPTPVVLSGTGTGGALSVSPPSPVAFGTDPSDRNGYVGCNATGTPHTLTLSNVGNQTLQVTGVALGKTSSPFTLTGPPASASTANPVVLGIGGITTLTITPSTIPAAVADPNDATEFSDVLTIATDSAGGPVPPINLVMQPYGAVVVGAPAQTTWSFGTIGAGSIGTFTTTIQNTGNAPATVALQGLSLPMVFGLANNPTTVPPKSIAGLVGQFTPPSPNGAWTDRGQMLVQATPFCEPLPMAWNLPNIDLSGSSNANPPVTASGSLVFPAANCGGPPPAGQSVTLANATNQAIHYTVKFGSGTWYTLTDGGSGILAANGTATIVVNPKSVSPGQGVQSGSAAYADDLLISVATSASDAGAPSNTSFAVPIGWTLNGAVLSLGPGGAGPYKADSTGAFNLPMSNSGTGTAVIDFATQPAGAFSVAPSPVSVLPNIQAQPQLLSAVGSAACPATTMGTATFQYSSSSPICQPFAVPSVSVVSCVGAQ
jgi:hypothetical protein